MEHVYTVCYQDPESDDGGTPIVALDSFAAAEGWLAESNPGCRVLPDWQEWSSSANRRAVWQYSIVGPDTHKTLVIKRVPWLGSGTAS